MDTLYQNVSWGMIIVFVIEGTYHGISGFALDNQDKIFA